MTTPAQERRKHKRYAVACPAQLIDEKGACLGQGKVVNVSDGGALVPLTTKVDVKPGQSVAIELAIPRSTPNTFLMEDFRSRAIVVRQDPSDDGVLHVAVRFAQPLQLDMEV